jgi:uncharacterized membrane protein
MAKKKKKKNMSKTAAAKKHTQSKTDAKKAAVLGTEKKSRLPLMAAVICAALLIGVTYFFIPRNNSGNTNETLSASSQTSSNTPASKVAYPASLFDDGKARHFAYKTNDITIKYFVIKSSDGVIRAAFDACDVCWPAGKGYYQDGDYMVCRNCGRRFASNLVNVVQGGCNPAPLDRAVEDNQLVIYANDILKGKQYFDFSNRT